MAWRTWWRQLSKARLRRSPKALAWLLLSVGSGLVHAQAQTWRATVVHVTDGDTVYVRSPQEEHAVPVRLQGIDAPEICQAGGEAAREALQALVGQQLVTLVGSGQDSYGRELALLYWQGQDVGRWMVAQGHAWSYRHGQDPGPYLLEQRQAQAARRGLFAQDRPEPPRLFRQRHGSCKPGG